MAKVAALANPKRDRPGSGSLDCPSRIPGQYSTCVHYNQWFHVRDLDLSSVHVTFEPDPPRLELQTSFVQQQVHPQQSPMNASSLANSSNQMTPKKEVGWMVALSQVVCTACTQLAIGAQTGIGTRQGSDAFLMGGAAALMPNGPKRLLLQQR